MEKILSKYSIVVDNVPADVKIYQGAKELVPIYEVTFPTIEKASQAALDSVREKLLTEITFTTEEILNPSEASELKDGFIKTSYKMIKDQLPNLSEENVKILVGILLQHSLGLGPIEIMLDDRNLEEIVINSSKEPIWVYHIKLGWMKTNIIISSEPQIYNYASAIGRKVGEQITNLNPLMDAYLSTGDRTNATLFPISSHGNTLTIRKFRRRPWTITDFIDTGTLSTELAAFLWLAIQYELNMVISGGTASGKTSLLNSLLCFIPSNHRIISIEDTRELQLPDFLHWVPMTTRPPNPEGKGEITMLQLMINSLRMRPDRVVVGEIRRKREAEVLFEAINTGHSVYSTLHANTAEETYRRLANPPIGIPVALMSDLQLITVMHRDRRKNIRRVLQVAELAAGSGLEETRIDMNTVFRWIPGDDKIIKMSKSYRAVNDVKLFTGMVDNDIENDLKEKTKVLDYLVANKINDVNSVGRIVSEYYTNPKETLGKIKSGRLDVKDLMEKAKQEQAEAEAKDHVEKVLGAKIVPRPAQRPVRKEARPAPKQQAKKAEIKKVNAKERAEKHRKWKR